jgi:hypothetical protein
MAWIAEPLTFYAVLGIGIGLCVALFISLKKENAHLRFVLEQDRRLTVGKMEEFRSSMLRLQSELEQAQLEVKAPPEAASVEPAQAQSVNISKRSLALRMHRHGEPTDKIAATLNIPRNEVELLLKVHKTVLEQA